MRRAHPHCSPIKPHPLGARPRGDQTVEAMGRNEGGLDPKPAAALAGLGRAVALDLAAGPRHDLKVIVSPTPVHS